MSDIGAALSGSLDRDGSGGMRANLNMGGFRITGMAPGSAPGDVATVAQALGVPVGGSIDFWGQFAPNGWLFMAGQAISRVNYAELFAVIGTTYGIGDGVTTFNLPDCRANTTIGRADMGGTLSTRLSNFASTVLGTLFGSQSHTLVTGEMPAHNHTASTAASGDHTHDLKLYSGTSISHDGSPEGDRTVQNVGTATGGFIANAGSHTHAITVDNMGGGAAHNNVQPSIICNKIIRVSAT